MSGGLREVEAAPIDIAGVHTPGSRSPDSLSSARLSYYDERLSILEALSSDQLSSGGFDVSGRSINGVEVASSEDGASARLLANDDIHTSDGSNSRVNSECRYSLEESRIPLKQNWFEENDIDQEVSPLKVKKKKHVSLKIVAEEDPQLRKHPSFNYIGEDGHSNTRKFHGHSGLLRGPRKVLRLCIFALLIPLGLVVVPLYIRTVRYPPKMIAMAPSDQRLLDSSVSSIWCQGQSVQMNGSFNAYLLAKTPETKPSRTRYTILKNLKLRDDVKEYWGFYLRGGSTVTLSSCTRYEGGQLMILRGSENLHRCAWIGEEDSLEESPLGMPSKADLDNVRVDLDINSDENESQEGSMQIGSRIFTAAKEDLLIQGIKEQSTKNDVKMNSQLGLNEEQVEQELPETKEDFRDFTRKNEKRLAAGEEDGLDERPIEVITKFSERSVVKVDGLTESPTEQILYQNSEERQEHLNLLLKHALAISKGKDEVMNVLVSHTTRSQQQNDDATGQSQDVSTKDSENAIGTDRPTTPSIIQSILNKFSEKAIPSKTRTKRNVIREKYIPEDARTDGAFEVTDDDLIQKESVKKYTKEEIGVEQIIGGLSIPDGLTYERGFMNQSHGTDLSMEEHRSSYSSSEEALASCEGVILALPLQPDSHCLSFSRQESNKVTYQITEDGTYYFVFSSDNEIVVNNLFFNLTLDKVVYDTSSNLANCSDSQNCSLHLDFWSNEQTVVEVPADLTWDNSYVLNTECQPRVVVYLCLLLLVPILILLCAFQ
ncbi:protein of unknown function DUF4793 [Trinorchestia longiramus]|nr:protein of unknown function DUF4793 [Trinorchestia longiramus]